MRAGVNQGEGRTFVLCTRKTCSGFVRFGLPLIVCAIVLGYGPLYRYLTYHLLPFEDDAFYYFTIARNIHDLGFSTFDGQTLTNGYHPLWLIVLLLQYSICKSFEITILTELALVLGGLAFLISALKSRRLLDNAVLTLAYTVAISGFTLNGMEASLLVFCFSALIWTLERVDLSRDAIAIRVGLIAAATIGARIDAGVFVLPLLLLALPTRRTKTIACGMVAICGFAYLTFNKIVFDAVMPVSASVKSLGGLQLNTHLIHDFHNEFTSGVGATFESIFNSDAGDSDYYRILIVCLLAIGLALFANPRSFARHLLFAFLIGMTLYVAKLLFFSSWTIWSWYFFPEFIGAYACLRVAPQTLVSMRTERTRKLIEFGFLTCLIVIVLWSAESFATDPPDYEWLGFAVINQRAIDTFGPVFAGANVAMGDRAGSFAFHYHGSTTQLEGLAEDKEYFDVLAHHGDLKALLCRRGVKFVLAYARDLGNHYETYRIDVLRSWLTSFHGPSLTVSKKDEVGRVFGLDVFDSFELGDEGDSYLYAWRLNGCPQG